MPKQYRPRVSIDMKEEDVQFIRAIFPYGSQMKILKMVIEDFMTELKRNPDIIDSLLLRTTPKTTKVAVSRSLVKDILHHSRLLWNDKPPPLLEGLLNELEETLI